jgi:antitoxin component of RelBE/YafQ-DinJ toxin-antitoxin module
LHARLIPDPDHSDNEERYVLIGIRLDKETVDYFKALAEESGIAYQLLINLFLRDCAVTQKKPVLRWKDAT